MKPRLYRYAANHQIACKPKMMITLSALRCLGAVNAVSLYVERGGMTSRQCNRRGSSPVGRTRTRYDRSADLVPRSSDPGPTARFSDHQQPAQRDCDLGCPIPLMPRGSLPRHGFVDSATLTSWISSWASGDVISFK